MKIWQSHRYIPFFGFRFYYKRHFLKFCKVLGLPYYKNWAHRKSILKHKNRKKNGEKSNPNWAKNRIKELAMRDGKSCKKCKKTEHLTLDHIKELCISHDNSLKNLQILCMKCADEKSREFNKRTLNGTVV